jgi:multidrug efflux pump subunit AcrB
VANEGTATITVRFVLERDINDAANDVREKVASAMKVVPLWQGRGSGNRGFR